jgi:flagellar hook-length control protein FliK
MLLSVFSFSPSTTTGNSAVQGPARGSSGADGFAQFLRGVPASESHAPTADGQPKHATLNVLLNEFRISASPASGEAETPYAKGAGFLGGGALTANTRFNAEQLGQMRDTIDAALHQVSAASYPAEMIDALEEVRAVLENMIAQLDSAPSGPSKPETTVTMDGLIAELVAVQGDTSGATPEQGDTTPTATGYSMPLTMFSDLQSALSPHDTQYDAPLNALLAFYQTPQIYSHVVQGNAMPNMVVTPTVNGPLSVPQLVVSEHGVDVPDITLPTHADMRVGATSPSHAASVTPLVATQNVPHAEQWSAETGNDSGRFTMAEAMALSDETTQARTKSQTLETLAPLSQFAQALQADTHAPVTQTAIAPVVEAQSQTVRGYTQEATMHVPRGMVSDQVQVALKHASAEGLQRITIQLDPQELGRIDVRLELARDGATHIAFTADRPETIDMLQRDARLLERVLQEGGMKTDAGNMEFHLRQQPNQQHAGGQFNGGENRSEYSDQTNASDVDQGDAQPDTADELAALSATEYTTHDVHYGVNVQV